MPCASSSRKRKVSPVAGGIRKRPRRASGAKSDPPAARSTKRRKASPAPAKARNVAPGRSGRSATPAKKSKAGSAVDKRRKSARPTRGGVLDVRAKRGPGEAWYRRTLDYWEKRKPTVHEMSGGGVQRRDVAFSRAFLDRLKRSRAGRQCDFAAALDVGAGIGRVTRAVLLQHVSRRVDLLEPVKALLAQARKDFRGEARVQGFLCESSQKFRPARRAYDLVWCQWTLMYLADVDLVAFFKRIAKGLRAGGLIVVKENVELPKQNLGGHGGKSYEDTAAHGGVVRIPRHYEDIFKRAGLQIVMKRMQLDLGDDAMPVAMYALSP